MEIARIEVRCARIARVLNGPVNDEVILLRTARGLKKIHVDLKDAVRSQAPGNSRVRAAERMLDVMEQDLRSVLLNYPPVRGSLLRSHIERALDRSLEALDLLASQLSYPAPTLLSTADDGSLACDDPLSSLGRCEELSAVPHVTMRSA